MIWLIYAGIWHIINLALTLYDALHWLQWRLQPLKFWSYDRRLSADDAATLQACSRELTKRPQHLCVIIAASDKRTDEAVIQRLLSYAHTARIALVSVYDARSVSNDKHVDIANITPPAELYVERNKAGRGIVWSPTNTCNTPEANPAQLEGLTIRQYDVSDGQALIADVCGELFDNRQTSEVQSLLLERSLLGEHIDRRLLARLDIAAAHAEPELGIVFAPVACTYGMLPWHVRFTEFHTIADGRRFNASCFMDILCRYARCEQRWGK